MTIPGNDPSPVVDGLLPCPFCGGNAAHIRNDRYEYVECENQSCPLEPGTGWKLIEKHSAVAAWNTRTPMPARVEPAIPADERWAGDTSTNLDDVAVLIWGMAQVAPGETSDMAIARIRSHLATASSTDAPARVGEGELDYTDLIANLRAQASDDWTGEVAAQLMIEAADAFAALATTPTNTTRAESEGKRWRHVKRGAVYEVIGTAELQASFDSLVDGSEMVVYRGEDGKLWVREESEFHDGRFVPATAIRRETGEGEA